MATNGQTRTPRSLSPASRRALGWAAQAALVALATLSGRALDLPLGPAVDLLVGFGLGLALLGLGRLALATLRLFTVTVPAAIGEGGVLATLAALLFLAGFVGLPPLAAAAAWALWLGAFAALALGAAVAMVPRRSARARRPAWLRVAAPTLGVAIFAAAAAWWWHPGAPGPESEIAVAALTPTAADPGAAGPLDVASFTYGGGAPRWRDEYGAGAFRTTTPVDLADLVEVSAFAAAARRLALGHGLDAVPRNATVWHPAEGDGPYPLVLVAHGNANLFTPSELGYGWLGRHLASHGYVVASVDASAFNALPVVGGLRGENHARALLLLAHLQLWQAWQESGDVLARAVDLDRIVLVGHSRGGEAAAIAAAVDRLGRLPSDATSALVERVGGPHGVRAVVALAPSDGQSRVGDRGTALEGVDYLVVQGGHDADVTSFVGERQFERTVLGDGGFKAAVYLHEANHGQFNTRWGRSDLQPPLDALLRTAAIMPGDDQRRAGAALITAFLEASLRGADGYLDLFRDPATAAAWLPGTTRVIRYDDGGGVYLADFEEDVDPTTASLPGATARGEALTVWREGDPLFRPPVSRESNAVTLGWSEAEPGTTPAYRLAWPTDVAVSADAGGAVRLDLARGTAPFPDGSPPPSGALDAHVVVGDAAGRRAAVPLSHGQGVPPDLAARLARVPLFDLPRFTPLRYPVYATVDLPLRAFLEAEPEMDLGSLTALDLEFDLVPEGKLVVRSIAIVPGAAAAATR